jgi:choline dehydrogenase-like flavoprotein
VIKQVSSSQEIVDVCVVGTGPVGMALALELDRRGRDVLVLESGGEEAKDADASVAEIVDPARHAPMNLAVRRALGGTSWTWGGRCVPYDDIDFMPRGYVAEAHWPIGVQEIRPWYAGAATHLLCGSDNFHIPYPRTLTHGLVVESVERWARDSRITSAHRSRLVASERIQLSLNSTVTGINLSRDGQNAESLAVSTHSGHCSVKARRFVLAMGGVETARFLLHVQQQWPRHFGGLDGPLGRYYMGHISGKIANVCFDHPSFGRDFDFVLDPCCGAYYRRRFMLAPEAQLKNRVLNTAFWPDNPAFYDPHHGSGVLSGVFLALAFQPTGRRLLPEAIRLAHIGPQPYPLAAHLRNAILGAPQGAADVYRILRDRFLKKPRKPGFLVQNRGGKYALHYHAEQVPTRESRITVSREKDSFGMARAVIDLRYVDQDVQSVIESHKMLDEALRANGVGRLEYMYPTEELRDRVYAQASDGFHQVGTTRMGTDPKTSVVDSNLRIHGLSNLFAASSGVFPTSGQANSTLLAVALALRLAEHMDAQTSEASQTQIAQPFCSDLAN